MILSKEQSKWIFNKIRKMKSVGGEPVSEQDILNWCHTINRINSLELDETEVAQGFFLDKYKIDNQFKDLILPYQVTFKGEDHQANLLSDDYFEYGATNRIEGGKVLNPEEFNDISDAIMAAFKKTANFVLVENLKGTESLENYYKRESHDGKTFAAQPGQGWVPVELKVNVAKPRFMSEDSNWIFQEWFNALLRQLKGGKTTQGE